MVRREQVLGGQNWGWTDATPLEQNKAYSAAMEYLELGIPIIPICAPDHVGESLKHKELCQTPGKTPVIAGWQEKQYVTQREIFRWFAAHPNRNIGTPLGNVSGLIGVDIDGDIGEELLAELAGAELPGTELPGTWEFTTGKGRRLLYLIPEGVKVRKFKRSKTREVEGAKVSGELALLGDGQQTVLPPSVHFTGRKYEWVPGHSPGDGPPALAPSWMLELMTNRGREGREGREDVEDVEDVEGFVEFSPPVTQDEWSGTVMEGERQDRLKRLAGSLLHRNTIPVEEVLSFLKHWNQTHCIPPWNEEELETLVRGLAFKELTQREIKKEDGRGRRGSDFKPTHLATRFVEDQKAAGWSWHYSVKSGTFYRCDDTKGPWRMLDKQLVANELRSTLVEQEERWDSVHFQTEMMEALKKVLTNTQLDDYLDLGCNVTLRPEVLDYVSVKNGLLAWKESSGSSGSSGSSEGVLYPWDTNTYLTVQLPVEWRPDMRGKIEEWEEALEMWLPDKEARDFLQEFVGYCLLPDTSQRMAVMLFGNGSNGKSLFIDCITKLFGDAISFTPLHMLSARFEAANLLGKLINICGDIDPEYLKETGLLKALISGDKIRAEYKFGKSFYFTPTARLMFSANELPKTRDKSLGWYSRWRFVEFPNHFEDVGYKGRLLGVMSKEEKLQGLLAWAVEGLRRLKLEREGAWSMSTAIEEAGLEYMMDNDSVVYFCEARLIWDEKSLGYLRKGTGEGHGVRGSDGKGFYINKEVLYRYYKWFCDENGLKAVSMPIFSKQLCSYCGVELVARPPRFKDALGRQRVSSFDRVSVMPQFEQEFNFVAMNT